ncbi:MAG: Lrp/AsnC family transcriptional regulator [Candidatus Woesearchaeota archaeon]
MINEKDLEIIAHLREDGRKTLTNMSRELKMPISTIFDRMRKFDGNIMRRYVGLIDFQSLGYNARAQVMIKSIKSRKNELLEFLMKHENVNSVFKINNGFDFMIDIIFRNVRDLEDFIEKLDEKYRVKTKISYYIIDELKKEEFLSNRCEIKPV